MIEPHSLYFEQALLPEGWAARVSLRMHEGRIVEVMRDVDPSSGDERHAIGIPGMPNVHSHAFQRGMAGLTETRGPAHDNFWTWREVMYRFVGRLGPGEFQAVAALAYMEMLESGFTHVGEFHYFHRPTHFSQTVPIDMIAAICAAASKTGIGLTLLPSFYAHSNCGGKAPLTGQRPFLLTLEEYSRLLDDTRKLAHRLAGAVVGVAPHSLRAVSPEELAVIVPLAQDGPIHIHAAEQTQEVEDCLRWSGQRPVEWLLEHAPVDERWCIIHAIHMTSQEITGLARSGAVAGLCPVTEANLGDGIFPTPSFLHDGRMGIGTDSNVLIGVADELRTLEYTQRLITRSRNVLCRGEGSSNGGTLYRSALSGGSQALGIGSGLAEGSFADIVSLDAKHPSLAGKKNDQILDSFLFSSSNRPVSCVWRAGCKVVSDGAHIERENILARYRDAIAKIV
ncbi:formimidoylglutamate deiminase [Silvibacterium dinghuense]|uniref:Formimidoylglutamate deiminase n=1 Tax=Silvibacterium dinghuense TaxID=1560006 RepID=A0A4Q1SCC8_9BACT|nr:formimidoylglutamate deiminase [Silvibacterium dinghuense]RXS94874.1 formimidoylglutamate deiminase [Silvibacterium dinghuense]